MMKIDPNDTIQENTKVLYIKLGEKGMYEQECIDERQILKVGYNEVDHDLCLNHEWEKVEENFKHKHKPGVAKRHVKQIKEFYEAGDDVLWITFYKSKLWWCFSKCEVIQLEDKRKTRPAIGEWKCVDKKDKTLTFDRLSGSLLSLQAFRGTICAVHESKYVINKLNGIESEEVKEARNALDCLEEKLEVIIRKLHWKDFEALIDLIFRQAGWQRLSLLGEEQKTFDLDLRSPITGDRYLAQVKSKAKKKHFESFKKKCKGMQKDYERFYFIVHSPSSALKNVRQNGAFELISVKKVAQWAVQHGLANWVIEKAH